jgi:hypothetical protein
MHAGARTYLPMSGTLSELSERGEPSCGSLVGRAGENTFRVRRNLANMATGESSVTWGAVGHGSTAHQVTDTPTTYHQRLCVYVPCSAEARRETLALAPGRGGGGSGPISTAGAVNRCPRQVSLSCALDAVG